MRLRTKIFLIFSILASVPLLILTLFSYQRYVQTTYQRMDELSSRLFENAVDETNLTLQNIKDISLAFNFYYKDGASMVQELEKYADKDTTPSAYEYYATSKTLGRTCQSLLLADSDIYGIYIFTPSGYIFDYSNNQNGTIPTSYGFEADEWYQETLRLDGGYYISTVDDHAVFTGKQRSVFFSQCLKDVYTLKMKDSSLLRRN